MTQANQGTDHGFAGRDLSVPCKIVVCPLICFSHAGAPVRRLNRYEPPLSNLLSICMGVVVARIEAWTVRSSLHDGIL